MTPGRTQNRRSGARGGGIGGTGLLQMPPVNVKGGTHGTRLTVRINQPFEMSQYIARTMKGVMMDRRTTRFLYLGILVSSVLWGGLAVNPVSAAPITYTFAGTVTTVNSALSSQFNTTQTMSGQMTVSDVMVSSTYPILTFTNFKVGTYQATQLGTSGTVTIQNNNTFLNAPSTIDRFALFQSVNGASVNTYTPSYFTMDLRGPQSLFNSTALPTTVPSISSFNVKNEWRLNFSGGQVVVGQMSQLTAVPLPAAVVLFGAGLVALVGLGAGSWRPKRSQLVA